MANPDSLEFRYNESIYQDTEWMEFINWRRNMTEQKHYFKRMQGVEWIIANIMMVVLFPAILLINLLLLVTVLRNGKLRQEPWRWLIVHVSICIFISVFFLYMDFFTPIYLLPSFETTPLCPAIKVVVVLLREMMKVSMTLILIERFHAVRLGMEKEGGMDKKAVIVTLTVFWILEIAMHVAGFVHRNYRYGPMVSYHEGLPGLYSCYLGDTHVTAIANLIISTWSAVSAIVVFIGLTILACKRPNDDVKRTVIIPTIVVCLEYLFLCSAVYFIDAVLSELRSSFDFAIFFSLHILVCLFYIIFPTTWLVTWSLNRDIALTRELFCPCIAMTRREEFNMLEEQVHSS